MKIHIRPLIALISTISILVALSICPKAENESTFYFGGALPNTLEEMEPYVVTYNTSTYSSLPTYVDNTNNFPTPGNQGNVNNCAAWALAYALRSAQEHIKRDWSLSSDTHIFSPNYIYNQVNNGTNKGMSLGMTALILVSQGACPTSYFDVEATDYTTAPESIHHTAASFYTASRTVVLKTANDIKTRIASGDGVAIAVEVYPDLINLSESNPIYDTVNAGDTPNDMGHAICLIGYDDDKQAFKFINSSGTDWGLDGYGWISYNFVASEDININGANRGYTFDPVETDNYIIGDIDEDGSITDTDANLALRYASSIETPTDRQFVLADVDGNASITAADSRHITRFSSGLITQMPLYD